MIRRTARWWAKGPKYMGSTYVGAAALTIPLAMGFMGVKPSNMLHGEIPIQGGVLGNILDGVNIAYGVPGGVQEASRSSMRATLSQPFSPGRRAAHRMMQQQRLHYRSHIKDLNARGELVFGLYDQR